MKLNKKYKNFLTKKKCLLYALLSISVLTNAENRVEVDLNKEILTSTEGLIVNYGEMKLNVLNARRDLKANKLYLEDRFNARMYHPMGRSYFQAKSGVVGMDGSTGEFIDGYGTMEVGRTTNAEYPNDKIYFGAPKIDYKTGIAIMENGWITTDPLINISKDPNKAGYYLLANKLVVEQDKQITITGGDFYKSGKDYLPFSIPWYRVNIRKDSKVPLFPMWGDEDDYGWTTSVGVLYGNSQDKLVGGFAPKFGDQAGFMIGRMENWYKFDKIGTSKLNVTDWLVHKKNNDVDNRYNFGFLHDYEGEKGNFNLNVMSSTYNMISGLDDSIRDFQDGKLWDSYGIDPLNPGDSLEMYSLDTSLKGLGERKDITLQGKVKRVSDRQPYEMMVYDYIDDGALKDYSLITDIKLYKENEDYKIGGYYNYLDVVNPGNSLTSDRSREESFGFTANDKNNNIYISYDKMNRDKYRPLSFIEKNSDLKPNQLLNMENNIMARADYTLVTIPEYDTYNSENIKVRVGKYSLKNDWEISADYQMKKVETELSLLNDNFRGLVAGNNLRDKQYNRYEDIMGEKTFENRGAVTFENEGYGITLAGGNSREIIKDREGFYNDNIGLGIGYTEYVVNSEYAELGLSKKEFNSMLGEIKIGGNLRYDSYSKNEINGKKIENGKKDSLRQQLELGHKIKLNESGEGNLENKFGYFYQNYSNKSVVLQHKNNINKFTEELKYENGNLKRSYIGEYSINDRASTGKKEKEYLNQKINWDFTEDIGINVYYDSNKKYTDNRNNSNNIVTSNYNNLTLENYGGNLRLGRNNFRYGQQNLSSKIYGIAGVDNSNEKIRENIYSYSYKFQSGDEVGVSYNSATDRRTNEVLSKKEVDIEKQLYSVSYKDAGKRYDNTYSVSYGKNIYGIEEKMSTDVFGIGYSFLDKNQDMEFNKIYAAQEFLKSPEEVTTEDMDRVAILMKERASQNNKNSTNFDLESVWKRPVAFTGDYTRKFSFNTSIERDKARYEKTDDLLKSIKNWNMTLGYSQRRIGVGYTYSQESGWANKNGKSEWGNISKEHLLSLNAKIGKPSEGYRVTTYGKLEREAGVQDDKPALGLGIELGKEMGYYEWSVAYLREYSYSTKDYEWKGALQFTLLTFPDMPIFGIGSKTKAGGSGKTSLTTSLFDGIQAKDVD